MTYSFHPSFGSKIDHDVEDVKRKNSDFIGFLVLNVGAIDVGASVQLFTGTDEYDSHTFLQRSCRSEPPVEAVDVVEGEGQRATFVSTIASRNPHKHV